MFVLLIILLFAPGMIAAQYYQRLSKKEFSVWDWIYQYAKFIYAITFLNIAVLFLRGWSEFAFERISVVFAVKYLGLSLVLAVVLPWVNNKWSRHRK